jgi:hypothetical protein
MATVEASNPNNSNDCQSLCVNRGDANTRIFVICSCKSAINPGNCRTKRININLFAKFQSTTTSHYATLHYITRISILLVTLGREGTLKSSIVWVITPCSPVKVDRCFGTYKEVLTLVDPFTALRFTATDAPSATGRI